MGNAETDICSLPRMYHFSCPLKLSKQHIPSAPTLQAQLAPG